MTEWRAAVSEWSAAVSAVGPPAGRQRSNAGSR